MARHHVKITRDLVLFCLGILIIVNEAFVDHGSVRVELLGFGGLLVGLPIFLRADEKREKP
jgi:hypothetical protein